MTLTAKKIKLDIAMIQFLIKKDFTDIFKIEQMITRKRLLIQRLEADLKQLEEGE